MKKHIRERRTRADKFFLTSKDIASMKLDEAIAHSVAKREGKKLVGVRQQPCGCGAEGCNYTTSLYASEVNLPKCPKKPTKHPKRKKHPMFCGKIIE